MMIGKYTVVSKNTETGEESIKHEQNNLITDYGMNYFAQGSRTTTANAEWSVKDCGVWLKDFPDPSVTQVELPLDYVTGLLQNDIRTKFVFNYGNNPSESGNITFDDGKVCYIETTYTYTFDQGAIVGDMYGAYIGCADTYGTQTYINYSDPRMYPWMYDLKRSGGTYIYDHCFSIFSALKFKDAAGLPILLSVAPIEQIFIRYTLRRYLPKYVPPKVFNFETEAGTSHKCIIEPTYWDEDYNGYWSTYSSRNAFTKFKTTYADKYQSLTLYNPSGGSYSYPHNNDTISITVLPYTNYSYKQNIRYSFGINNYNQAIAKIDFFNSMGAMRATFTPPVPKNNTLATSFEMGWGWGREEDLITNFRSILFVNPNFATDLTGWVIPEVTSLINYTQNGKTAISLRTKNKTEVISQTLNLSAEILENRRVTLQYQTEGNLASLFSIKLDYLDSEGVSLATDTIDTSKEVITDINLTKYLQRDVPVAAITAQSVIVSYTLKTNNTDSAFISLTGTRMLLNNLTPIIG